MRKVNKYKLDAISDMKSVSSNNVADVSTTVSGFQCLRTVGSTGSGRIIFSMFCNGYSSPLGFSVALKDGKYYPKDHVRFLYFACEQSGFCDGFVRACASGYRIGHHPIEMLFSYVCVLLSTVSLLLDKWCFSQIQLGKSIDDILNDSFVSQVMDRIYFDSLCRYCSLSDTTDVCNVDYGNNGVSVTISEIENMMFVFPFYSDGSVSQSHMERFLYNILRDSADANVSNTYNLLVDCFYNLVSFLMDKQYMIVRRGIYLNLVPCEDS